MNCIELLPNWDRLLKFEYGRVSRPNMKCKSSILSSCPLCCRTNMVTFLKGSKCTGHFACAVQIGSKRRYDSCDHQGSVKDIAKGNVQGGCKEVK